jgi:hypothetical protein
MAVQVVAGAETAGEGAEQVCAVQVRLLCRGSSGLAWRPRAEGARAAQMQHVCVDQYIQACGREVCKGGCGFGPQAAARSLKPLPEREQPCGLRT